MLSFPAFRTLHWLSTAQFGQHPPDEVCPANDARPVFDELVGLRYIEDSSDYSGGFGFVLTDAGRAAAHRLRGEYRPEVARRAVLSHLNEAGGLVGLDGLENNGWAQDFTDPLTDRDIAEAADDLEFHGMIAGQRQGNGRFYLARITPAGRTALRGPSPIGATGGVPATSTHYTNSTITTITGDHNQVAAGIGGDVTQHASTDNSTTIDYQAVDERIQALLADLPNLGADPTTANDIQTNVEVIQGEIVSASPDPTVVTRALNAVRGLLAPIGLGIAGAVTTASSELATGYIQDFTNLLGF
ncbi:hypothetical protein K8O93_07240 [Gordonia bronchialis]|uniref:hypothetical protein n=1 Tax=Gordonia bronchialis TaxID=2054 RepID=UPI001CBEDBBA|nr:hypothetical protein [Gordonia bronchialis]UAK39456.1 hypothetical protein K8O93_07240 [Gordonia bronchialis]